MYPRNRLLCVRFFDFANIQFRRPRQFAPKRGCAKHVYARDEEWSPGPRHLVRGLVMTQP